MALGLGRSFLLALTISCAVAEKLSAKSINITSKADGNGFLVDMDFSSSGGLLSGAGNIKLDLKKPSDWMFGKNFLNGLLGEDGIFQDMTDHVKEHASDIFVDDDNDAVVSIKTDVNGEVKMNGFINQHHQISHDGESHVIVKVPETQGDTKQDYVDLNIKLTPGPQARAGGVTYGSAEVVAFFDYSNYQKFNGDSAAIQDYLSIFFRAVQNRYNTINDPKINIILNGFIAFNSRSAQPFVEAGRIRGANAYDMNTVLSKMSYWIKENKNKLPYFDVVALISGEKWMSKNDQGVYQEGIAGLAYLGGACLEDSVKNLGCSVNSDTGKWDGVLTAAHELAHNFNSPHDPNSGSAGCNWDLGYIMSYVGYGTTNKFLFSPCSKRSMKDFINSQEGSCMKSRGSSQRSIPLSNTNPGDRYSLDEQCQQKLSPTAKFYNDPSDPDMVCRNLKCQDGRMIYTMNRVPLDNSPCGNNKVCKNGNCVWG